MNGLVEVWGDFITLLNEIYPLLKAGDKVKSLAFKSWARLNQNRHDGIAVVNINMASSWLDTIRYYLPDELQLKMSEAICFIESLNGEPLPHLFKTKVGCEFWDLYWYDNSCHKLPKPLPIIPVEPEKEPEEPVEPVEPYEKVCINCKTELECLSYGCYWWDNACHDRPEPTIEETGSPMAEFAKQINEYCQTIPLTKPVMKTTCIAFKNMLLFLDEFMTWQQKKG